MAKRTVEESSLTAVADAIRERAGTMEELVFPGGFVDAITGIESGDDSGGLAFDMGEFALGEDVKKVDTVNGIPHSLEEKPDFILVWTDDFRNLTPDQPSNQQVNVGYLWLNGLTGLVQRLTSAASNNFGMYLMFIINSGDYRLGVSTPTASSYCIDDASFPTKEKIALPLSGNTNYWRTGVTYKYFVSKAWWNVGGVANAQ